MNKYPSPIEVLNIVEEWTTNRNFRNISSPDIEREYESLFSKLPLKTSILREKDDPEHKKRINLHRIRKTIDQPCDIDQFWAKPCSISTEMRCNHEGQGMLYAGESLLASLIECRVNNEDEYYHIHYGLNDGKELIVADLRPRHHSRTHFDEDLSEEDLLSLRIVRLFMFNEFMVHVGAETSYLYNKTSALFNFLRKKYDVDGIQYSSIKNGLESNLAILPFVAKDKLKITALHKAKFVGEEEMSKKMPGVEFHKYGLRNFEEVLEEGVIKGDNVAWSPIPIENKTYVLCG